VERVCGTCRVLLNRLQDAKEKLVDATLRMRVLMGTGRHEAFEAALRQTQSLQMECRVLRAEVERHKAQHGESATQD
jgi:hypothetical protein